MSRLICIVPFCRRTRSADREPRYSEWCCPEHWRHVPQRLKLLRRRAHRYGRRRLDDMLWVRCKRAAIEAAGGIR